MQLNSGASTCVPLGLPTTPPGRAAPQKEVYGRSAAATSMEDKGDGRAAAVTNEIDGVWRRKRRKQFGEHVLKEREKNDLEKMSDTLLTCFNFLTFFSLSR
jgi:hypothetical protein